MEIHPLRLPFDLSIALPGSKSEALRTIVAAALARGRTTILDATPGDDVVVLVEALRAMGFAIEWFDATDGVLQIEGGIPPAADPPRAATLDCRHGGAPLRFLCALAALVPGTWTLTGSPRLLQRPLEPLLDALRHLGAKFEDRDVGGSLTVRGGALRGGTVPLDASASSQHLSALLLVAPLLDGDTTIELAGRLASVGYAELTARVLSRFGADLDVQGRRWSIASGPLESPGDVRLEGDWSAAGALLVLARLTRSRFRGTNLRVDSAQIDRLVPLLIGQLSAGGDLEIDLADTPDQAPNLVVAALFRDGITRFVGAPHLHDKESDRIAALSVELQKTGASVEPTADGFVVRGGVALHGAQLTCHADHRLAMAFAVLGSIVPGVTIDDPACVTKSYPRFFDDLRSASHSARCIALIGMRGAGKSTLAPALAAELALEPFDTDAEFEREHGAIGTFVARHGWPAFRAHEASILARCLVPGRVVAVGGGAVENPSNADLLRDRAVVAWLQNEPDDLVARLRDADRPPLTDRPLDEEVRTVLARREPTYAAIAQMSLRGGDVASRVRALADWLRGPWRAHESAAPR